MKNLSDRHITQTMSTLEGVAAGSVVTLPYRPGEDYLVVRQGSGRGLAHLLTGTVTWMDDNPTVNVCEASYITERVEDFTERVIQERQRRDIAELKRLAALYPQALKDGT